jgi:uncharacterized protein YjbI with pentapeptide repeats
MPLTHTTIHDDDWTDHHAVGLEHSGVAFVDVDMCEATNERSVFTECTFTNVRFNCSTQTDVAFLNCAFVGCSFFDATFTRCKLVGSTFDRCTFELLKVEEGDWSFVALPGAKLGSAEFTGVRMREADLTGARCEGGVFRDVDLSGAALQKADLTRCDLRWQRPVRLDPQTTDSARPSSPPTRRRRSRSPWVWTSAWPDRAGGRLDAPGSRVRGAACRSVPPSAWPRRGSVRWLRRAVRR